MFTDVVTVFLLFLRIVAIIVVITVVLALQPLLASVSVFDHACFGYRH